MSARGPAAALRRAATGGAWVFYFADAPTLQACAETVEIPGAGIEAIIDGRTARLGSRAFAATSIDAPDDGLPELWFATEGAAPVRFAFADALRPDASETIAALKARGLAIELLSGDHASAVAHAAASAGIDAWRASVTPADKIARVQELRAAGARVLMIGDGLNDAAALAAAHASASPGTAVEASQAAADIVVQVEPALGPVRGYGRRRPSRADRRGRRPAPLCTYSAQKLRAGCARPSL